MFTLETERLLLRPWRDDVEDDAAAFRYLGDPVVRAHFPTVLDRDQSRHMKERFRTLALERGFSFFALELRQTGEVIGHHGLHWLQRDLPFHADCSGVEIGWSLARDHWGKGYATEMGQEVLSYAREALALRDLVSFTPLTNGKSLAVMARLGMTPWTEPYGGVFDHPDLPLGHRLRRHHLMKREL